MNEFIEKLIERFEEEYLQAEKDMELSDTCDEASRCGGRAAAYEKAQKIVNQLAGEYNNDFCEWEKGSSGYVGYPAYYSKCCTTNSNGLEMQTHIISDWKFCPYCGKKIKIAPYQPKGENDGR